MAKFKAVVYPMRVVKAGKRRKCYHSKKHEIVKGDRCFEIKEGMGWKGYCVACAKAMLDEGSNALLFLLTEVGKG